jgi:hypothetical protein
MKIMKAAAILATASFLWGCAQPEPEPIAPEPTYDKYGNVVS